MYLGIKAVIAKSFARIHHANLINFGILPITFVKACDYDDIDEFDEIEMENLHSLAPNVQIKIQNKTKQHTYDGACILSALDVDKLMAGGTLQYIKKKQ